MKVQNRSKNEVLIRAQIRPGGTIVQCTAPEVAYMGSWVLLGGEQVPRIYGDANQDSGE